MDRRNRDRRIERGGGPLPALAIFTAVLLLFCAVAFYAVYETSKTPLVLATIGLGALAFGLTQDPGAIRNLVTSRSVKYGTLAFYQVTLVLLILVCINIYAIKYPYSRDMTRTSYFTLSDQTRKIFSNLDEPVKAYAFFNPPGGRNNSRYAMEDLLTRCERLARGRFAFEFVDPDKNPALTMKYKVLKPGTTVFIRGENQTKITSVSEEAVVNAIIRITRTHKKKIYCLAGHGEADIKSGSPSGFKLACDDMRANQYDVVELHLYREKKVPDDASVLVIAGPQKALLENERDMLGEYLKTGGKLVVLLDPNVDSKLEPLLEDWGVIAGNDMVVDFAAGARLHGQNMPTMPVISQYNAAHEITKNFNLLTFFPLCRSVSPDRKSKGTRAVPLLFTTKQSWAVHDLERLQPRPGDKTGPVSIAVAAVKAFPKTNVETRLVVIGDSDFATNRYYQNLGNGNFFQNCVNWAARDTDLISIRPKTLENTPLRLTRRDDKIINLVCLVIVPLLFLAAGGTVWFVRRSL